MESDTATILPSVTVTLDHIRPILSLQGLLVAVNDTPLRTVTLQDSYDAVTPSTVKDNVLRGDSHPLVGFQMDPQMEERKRKQQRAESQAAKTRRVRLSRELLSTAEAPQIYITVRDTVRLQR